MKNFFERLLFEDVVDEEPEVLVDQPITEVGKEDFAPVTESKPVEEVKTEENRPETSEVVRPVTRTTRTLIDLDDFRPTRTPYNPPRKPRDRVNYTPSEPISPMFGMTEESKKDVSDLTQLPADIKGSDKIDTVISPIFGKLDEGTEVEEKPVSRVQARQLSRASHRVEKHEDRKPPVIEKPKAEPIVKAEEETPTIDRQEEDIFYTDTGELKEISKLIRESEKAEKPSTVDISIFDDFDE